MRESEYILPKTRKYLLAHVNLMNNTEAFQASEVYNGLAENFAIYSEDECQTATYFSSAKENDGFSAIRCKLKEQYYNF